MESKRISERGINDEERGWMRDRETDKQREEEEKIVRTERTGNAGKKLHYNST